MQYFGMWERGIHYEDGWFVYDDGKGHASVISEQRARALELGYVIYQAGQDINRGGAPEEAAYRGRGIKTVVDADGHKNLELIEYAADAVIKEKPPIALAGTLRIPEKIGQFVINTVSDEAFARCTSLERVILPETITAIGEKAFFGCGHLVQVTIPKSLAHMGADAFTGTQVNVNTQDHILIRADPAIRGMYRIPQQITVIGDHAFEGCKELTKLIIHDDVTHIGQHAFQDCISLAEVQLPKEIKELGFFAFYGCSSLEEIVVPEGATLLCHFRGCTKLKKVVIPASVTSIHYECFSGTALMEDFLAGQDDMLVVDHWLIRYKVNDQGSLVMADDIIGIADQDWSEHSRNTFQGLKKIHLSSSLKYIGSNAFERTGITEIDIPEGVISLKMSCFRGAPLRSITIPRFVESMDQWALMDCDALERIVFLGNTTVDWPAITGRKDRNTITVFARKDSSAHQYVKQYGLRYHLHFIPLKTEEPKVPELPEKSVTNPRPEQKDQRRWMLPGILAALMVIGLILILIDGKIAHREAITYVPYAAGLEPDTATELTLVSCERILETVEDDSALGFEQYGIDAGIRIGYTYAACTDEKGADVILVIEHAIREGSKDSADEGGELQAFLSPLIQGEEPSLSVRGNVVKASVLPQILSPAYAEALSEEARAEAELAFSEIQAAETYIEPYMDEAPTAKEVRHKTGTESVGRSIIAAGALLLLILLVFRHQKRKKHM